MSKKKRQKLRVALRKNRQKRTRSNKLTRDALGQGYEELDVSKGERVSGKGDLSRYRTVIGTDEGGGEAVLRDVDAENCISGRVLSAVGLYSLVAGSDGNRYECTIRRVVQDMSRDARNAVVTGDEVLFQPLDETTGVIERVNPRQGTISRAARGQEHVIVANVDWVLIVVALGQSSLKTNLVDRFLVSAEKGEVSAIVCINKVDLAEPDELQEIAGLYAQLGYEVVLTSALDGTGISRLRSLLKDRETVLAGQSGVGKSSLLNAIEPGFDLVTNEVSTWTQKGRHTTRRTVLLELGIGGYVVDTPGIRQFDLWDVIPEEVEGFFVEFRPFVTRCRFPNCSHTHESGCGVKLAVDQRLISRRRYESYLRIAGGDTQ